MQPRKHTVPLNLLHPAAAAPVVPFVPICDRQSAHTRTHTQVHTRTHRYTHTGTRAQVHAHRYTHTQVHAHRYTRACARTNAAFGPVARLQLQPPCVAGALRTAIAPLPSYRHPPDGRMPAQQGPSAHCLTSCSAQCHPPPRGPPLAPAHALML